MPKLLSESQVQQFLDQHKEWSLDGRELVRTYELPAFLDAIAFVRRVGEVAEANDHHPDIDIRYRKVTLRLTTHSKGGLTELDPKVAVDCDAAFRLKSPAVSSPRP